MFLIRVLSGDRGGQVFLLVLLGVLIAIPVMNALPPDHPAHVSTYTVTLLGKYLTYALLAVAVDLVWGYLGILSLGHAAFFALGGYAMGMYLMRQIGERGVYGNPELPDFMVFLNWQELPWFWHGFDQFWFAALMVFLAPGILAFVFGYLAFRSRVTGVYLSIITQALTYALMLAFFRNEMAWRWRSATCLAEHSSSPDLGGSRWRYETRKTAHASSVTRWSTSSSRSLPSQRCWQVWPARCMCRRSASSIPGSLPR